MPHLTPSRSAVFVLHPLAQNRVDPAEVSLALRFEPGEDIVVYAERDLGFEGDDSTFRSCAAPIARAAIGVRRHDPDCGPASRKAPLFGC